MRILNMTQHTPTPDQIEAGVVQPEQNDADAVKKIITFDEVPTIDEIKSRARTFAELAQALCTKYECEAVMIGGASYFVAEQEIALWRKHVRFCYAFSKRVVQEKTNPDGTVTKVMIFKHAGFVWPSKSCTTEV